MALLAGFFTQFWSEPPPSPLGTSTFRGHTSGGGCVDGVRTAESEHYRDTPIDAHPCQPREGRPLRPSAQGHGISLSDFGYAAGAGTNEHWSDRPPREGCRSRGADGVGALGGEGIRVRCLCPVPNSVPSSLHISEDFRSGQTEAQQLVWPLVSSPTQGDHPMGTQRYSNLKEDPTTGTSLDILVVMGAQSPAPRER